MRPCRIESQTQETKERETEILQPRRLNIHTENEYKTYNKYNFSIFSTFLAQMFYCC